MARTSRWRLLGDAPLPRRRRPFDPCCHVRADDDLDDLDLGPPRRLDEDSTSAGMIAFIFSMASLGLLLVVLILYYFKQQEDARGQNVERTRWLLYWFLFVDFLSFCASMAAVIFSVRGLAPANRLYRGWSMAALILGILEIVITMILGLVMTCAVAIFLARAG